MDDLSWVTVLLTAHHTDPHMGEGRHAHTWRVTVYWPADPFRDGRAICVALEEILRGWQGADLPPELWSSEALAAFILRVFPADICGATVDRPDFGGAGRWR